MTAFRLCAPCKPHRHQTAAERRWQRAKRLNCLAAKQSGAGSAGADGAACGAGGSDARPAGSSSPGSSPGSTGSPGSPGSPGSSPGSTSANRRALLAMATTGGLYAWAGRGLAAADAANDAALRAAAEAAAAGASSPAIAAPSGASLEALRRQLDQRVSEFTLPNGLRFIVYERHSAPIVSFHVYADVGAYEERDGQTGLAHLLEHMAFKGTPRIGTTDFRREAPLLDALDEVFYGLQEAGNLREAGRLRQQFESLQKQAAELSVPNAFGAMLSREGGVGLNAATSHDATKFFITMPVNKAELWFALESERFQAPVFRELYSEKQVVLEERRLRVDNSPLGPFSEQFALRSFSNNYRRPVIGFPEDLERIGRREVQQFFSQHYGPRNLTVAVAGDVRPEQIRSLAERYFGGWAQPADGVPPSSCSAAAGAAEARAGPSLDVSRGEWEYRARSRAGPAVMQAYYRPCINSPDSIALDMASDLLSGTRSSRLYTSLVLSGKALAANAYASYPAGKHATQFVVYGVPGKGSSLVKLDADLSAEVEALASYGPTADELRRYKKSARVELLGALGSSSAVAAALSTYQALTGDWRNALTDLQSIEDLTAAEARDAAARWLRPDNVFKGFVLSG